MPDGKRRIFIPGHAVRQEILKPGVTYHLFLQQLRLLVLPIRRRFLARGFFLQRNHFFQLFVPSYPPGFLLRTGFFTASGVHGDGLADMLVDGIAKFFRADIRGISRPG